MNEVTEPDNGIHIKAFAEHPFDDGDGPDDVTRNPLETGVYKGIEYAVYPSPLWGENGYVHIPEDIIRKLESMINHGSRAINITERYDLVQAIIDDKCNGVIGIPEMITWLTYGDEEGWIGFDVNHSGEAFRNEDGSIETISSMMNKRIEQYGLDMPKAKTPFIARVWDREAVINEIHAIIDRLLFTIGGHE